MSHVLNLLLNDFQGIAGIPGKIGEPGDPGPQGFKGFHAQKPEVGFLYDSAFANLALVL